MDLLLTGEQEQIVASTASFATDRLPLRRLHGRNGPADEIAPTLWRETADMGWLGMGVGEDFGGVGYSAAEEALVFRELGRVCAPPRILFTALAARAAAAANKPELAAKIISGALPAAYAAQDDFTAPADSLAKRRLYDFNGAALALLLDADRVRLLDIAGRNFDPVNGLDKSVSMSVADLSAADVLCDATTPSVRQAASLLSAAMYVGIAEATRDMITEYAKIRTTFGKPIGAYQAVRHPISEMAVRCEEARAQLFYAALAFADGRPESDLHVSAVRVLAETAALKNVDDNIQLHGGIGVTDEFDAHFYLKRARTMTAWFSSQREHLKTVLDAQLTAF
ncbi:MAG: acyl-CoA dehydrogenase family protein [Hyphomonadaceae bacterium]